MISGVAQVQVYGAQKYAVRIQLDPQALSSRGLGIDQVVQAVQENNVNLPTGTLWGRDRAFTVQATGQLNTAEGYRPIVVAYRDGAPVRLQDLGKVFDSVQNDKTANWFRDTRAIMLAIQRQPGTNTVEVAGAVKALLPAFRSQLPASASLHVMFDRSVSIQESVRDVKFTLGLTLVLVILVIFLFLRNVSATVIPSLSLPLSIVGTFSVMGLLGYNIDNLSLMALTLAVGFVVDDAIVMLENIVRHLEMGKAPYQAAVDGAKEVGFTIVSMTLSLAAVFIPLLFMGGIIGRLFREFAVTISVAILVSGFVSLSLTPMMCSRFLRAHKQEGHGRFYQASEAVFDRSLKFYEETLQWVVAHKRATVVLSAGLFALTLYLFAVIPKGFIPSEDIGFLFGTTEAAEGIGFDAMKDHQQAVAGVLLGDPDVEAFSSSVFGGNAGRVFMRLKPRGQRKLTADQKVQELRIKMAKVPGIRVFLMNPPPINIGGRFAAGLYQFTLQGTDLDALYKSAPLLEAGLRQNDMLQDVTSDLRLSNPEVNVVIDRDQASSLGVSPQRIEDSLFSAYGSRQISTILAPNNQYYVILELLPQFQNDPAALGYLYVRASGGDLVPLSAISHVRQDIGPLSVNHSGQLPSVTISFNLRPGVALSEAVDSVQKAARATLPSTIVTNFSGTAQAFQSSQAGLFALLVLAILVIYMILGILYESFIHPITILSGLPFAGFGALVTLLIFRVDLNVYSFVGLIMLIGVVKKNAIMMIDFAVEAQREGMSARDAILKACSIRFRPIMMTTMAALMGTLPIALGLGAGSEARRPLGLAVVGGLLFSQLLTLYVTPVFYIYFDKVQTRLSRRFSVGL
jgi:HAE1 family hydrophobic/amphiphilic exporter-1